MDLRDKDGVVVGGLDGNVDGFLLGIFVGMDDGFALGIELVVSFGIWEGHHIRPSRVVI